jgi:hypothetical protein
LDGGGVERQLGAGESGGAADAGDPGDVYVLSRLTIEHLHGHVGTDGSDPLLFAQVRLGVLCGRRRTAGQADHAEADDCTNGEFREVPVVNRSNRQI